MPKQKSFLGSLFGKMDWAAKTLGIPETFLENELKNFDYYEMTPGRIRVKMDDGSYECITATIVQHFLPYPSRWPYKGGMRISDTVRPDTLRGLAVEMTLKCGVVDIKFGGAKSGIQLPRHISEYSQGELISIVEAVAEWAIAEQDIIRPRGYVPATDMGATTEHMDAIFSKFEEITGGKYEGTPVTGLCEAYGGLSMRQTATGLGGYTVLTSIMKQAETPKIGKAPSVIVQGTGQVGRSFIDIAHRDGYKIVGVSNAHDAVYNPNGIDVSTLPEDREAPFSDVKGERCLPNDILTKPCDILVPAAIENSLTEENASLVQAKIILELANHPTTDHAENILIDNGIYIIPDILANAGGVTASYREWENSFGSAPHAIEMPNLNLEEQKRVIEIMRASTEDVLRFAQHFNTDLRGAAWLKAMDKITQAGIKKHRRWINEKYTPVKF